MKEILVSDFFSIEIENATLLKKELEDLQRQYPASSFLNFFYLKILHDHFPKEYERKKSQKLLTIPSRKLMAQSVLKYPLYDCVSNLYTNKLPEKSHEEINVKEEKEQKAENDLNIHSLIEKFSVNPPKIVFNEECHDPNANFAEESCKENDEIVSETLAIVYAQQGYTGKAEKILKKLSLQFPEKSVYFAELIKALKNKDSNQ